MAVAIEDAGFEVRDMLEWIYASGFSKGNTWNKGKKRTSERLNKENDLMVANGYEGWGNSGIKPAHEPIAFCRKPIEKGLTVAENVLKYGTGAICIDECRIPTIPRKTGTKPKDDDPTGSGNSLSGSSKNRQAEYDLQVEQGRFPANIICTDDALNDGVMTKSGAGEKNPNGRYHGLNAEVYGEHKAQPGVISGFTDSGSKSRYFDIDVWAEKHGLLQFPKASKRERNEGLDNIEPKNVSHDGRNKYIENPYQRHDNIQSNSHPTVKPVHLMSWLVRLVTPKDGVCLDPFMGSGTTGVACKKLGIDFIGIELSEEYCKIAEARINGCNVL